MHAVQLDLIWPTCYKILEFRWHHPEIKIILQVGAKAFEAIDHNQDWLVSRLKNYGPAIDYVLLDKSGGRGLGMDVEGLRPYLRAIRDAGLTIGLAVAGGLGPDTMHLVEPLIPEFPDLSWDAQGKLRPSGNAMDSIDWNMAGEYVKKASKILK